MDYSSGANGVAGAGFGLAFLVCGGVLLLIGLALFAFNIWMLIDSIGRQEYEFPNSTGNSKNLWVILLIVGLVVSLATGLGWIVAVFYYFMVFKKLKRGSVAPQWAQQPGAPQPPQQYAPPAPGYAPPAPPAYQPPPAPPAPPEAYMPPPAPPAPMEPPTEPEPPAEPPAAPLAE